jgi:hypothetical protein
MGMGGLQICQVMQALHRLTGMRICEVMAGESTTSLIHVSTLSLYLSVRYGDNARDPG